MTSRALLRRRVRPSAPTPIGAPSTLTSDDFDPSANGVAVANLTYTARDASGNLLASRPVSYEPIYTTVSAALGTVSAFPTTIPDTGLVPSVITITVLDAAGDPLPGIEAAQIVVSSTGTGNTIVQPTGVTNALGQVTASFTSTVAAAKTITATVCGTLLTDDASVTVSVGGGGGGSFLFESDWSAATGSTLTAVTDGGKWEDTFLLSYAQILEVVTPASVAANTGTLSGYAGNVLRTRQRGPSFASKPRIINVPQSTTHWLRWYFRNDETAARHLHPVSYAVGGSDGGIVIVPWARAGFVGGMQLLLPYGAAYPFNEWHVGTSGSGDPTLLTNGVWYRFEAQIQFLTATTVRIYPRIYNLAGTLLYTASNYYQTGFPWTTSLQDWYDAGNSATIASATPTQIFSIGNEGPAGSADNSESWYFAKLALSTAGWVGA